MAALVNNFNIIKISDVFLLYLNSKSKAKKKSITRE